MGVQTELQTSNAADISSSSFHVHYVPPRPRAMLDGMIVISQAMWDKAMKILAMLETKVGYMEEGVKPWVDTKLQYQDRRMQGRLDAFKQWITQQLGSRKTPVMTEVKSEVGKIKKMVNEFYNNLFILAPMIKQLSLKYKFKTSGLFWN